MNPAYQSYPVNVSPCIAGEYKFSFKLRFYQSVLNRLNLKRSIQPSSDHEQLQTGGFVSFQNLSNLLYGTIRATLFEKLCFKNNASLLDNNTHVLWKAETC